MGRSRELAELASAYDGSSLQFRNRIINGDMRIDQRNNGASVSVSGNYAQFFGVDRFSGVKNTSGVFSLQQSSVAPAGFTTSLRALVTTADASVAVDDFANITQNIEGFNVVDLGWGAAGAQSVTISFWVRSNVTGTYCCVLLNADGTRSYVSNYTINAANTWEQKTLTVAGDTTGTWGKTNGAGIGIRFGLMAGTNWQQAAGSWGTGNSFGSSSQTNWMATVNNEFYITGVQLEAGSVATPFERRPYGTELALCQRYYQQLSDNMRLPAMAFSTTICPATWVFQVPMRAVPTFNSLPGSSTILVGGSNLTVTSLAAGLGSTYGYSTDVQVASGATAGYGAQLRLVGGLMTASAEL